MKSNQRKKVGDALAGAPSGQMGTFSSALQLERARVLDVSFYRLELRSSLAHDPSPT